MLVKPGWDLSFLLLSLFLFPSFCQGVQWVLLFSGALTHPGGQWESSTGSLSHLWSYQVVSSLKMTNSNTPIYCACRSSRTRHGVSFVMMPQPNLCVCGCVWGLIQHLLFFLFFFRIRSQKKGKRWGIVLGKVAYPLECCFVFPPPGCSWSLHDTKKDSFSPPSCFKVSHLVYFAQICFHYFCPPPTTTTSIFQSITATHTKHFVDSLGSTWGTGLILLFVSTLDAAITVFLYGK